ncbi:MULTISPECIES: phosphatidate cytidylyltransferase [Paenibacillus]|uniref:Phosphatidate cytidylyltransferase n=1 Tax=Paenibacillus azoreducens TaxID=116718 RepID=A0A919YIU1_9BACL|nr:MULTISPECIES: phosphatidate cytidylyltransferase [Paenibacillus]MBE9913217.1 phosphatidate cytidylyltransferase [Paenibacillus donghaensis]GIO50363.1 phosphatidate cytidylyltransferase [Paenibacillus azoreducens]
MKQRLITGVIAGVVFLGFCLLGGLPFHLIVLAMAMIGYYEFVRMTKVSPFGGTALLGYLGVLTFMFPWELLNIDFPLSWDHTVWLLMFLFMLVTVITKNKIGIQQAAMLFLGVVYVGTGFSYIAASRSTPDGYGLFWTFLLLCSIWASDAGAYFVGKWIGRNKLWPAISPNKTIEGALGGVVISMATAMVFSLFSGGILGLGRALAIGLACAVVGQLGDLIQSAYKRVYGIKDSGTLLPGHGGILDRCDSWIIVFPFVHIMMLMPY